MKLRILGCSGGELASHRTSCFLLDGTLAVDAGALTTTLSLGELRAIDDIVLTHSHFDHVKDVPLLADLLIGQRQQPLVVHASPECARTLRENMFSGGLWPDFTRLPDPRHPILVIKTFDPGRRFRVGRYTVRSVPVEHPVESVGLVLSDGKDAMAISGDTGPTEEIWRVVNRVRNLRALLVETTFPSRLQGVADASGHLTPRTLQGELEKLDRDRPPVYLYHLKPVFWRELRRELAALKLDRVHILKRGDELAS